LGIAALATAIAVGRTRQRAMTGAALTFAVGGAILLVLVNFWPDAPVMVYQQTPTLIATVVVSLGLFVYSRRGEKKHPLERSINPLTA
jgi:peptidoglycan/LPS O-acetylase OafA/YrhL